MRLSGDTTYTGRTVLESGTLSVTSLNSFSQESRKASISLGAHTDIESGEIVIGEEEKKTATALSFTPALTKTPTA